MLFNQPLEICIIHSLLEQRQTGLLLVWFSPDYWTV
jgi:hypothetical protein